MRLFVILALLATALFSAPIEENTTLAVPKTAFVTSDSNISATQKIIYISYDNIPKRVFNGQVFAVSYKYLITNPQFKTLQYHFQQPDGLKLMTPQPTHTTEGIYSIDTFYFQDINGTSQMPPVSVNAFDPDSNTTYPITAGLDPQPLNVITLNPPNDFANIIAKNFQITDYKTTTYDNNSNIMLFSATARQSVLENMHISGIQKQGIESLSEDANTSTVIYYAVIPKDVQSFEFSYFNLLTQSYDTVSIPVVVVNDSVSTQTDLAPTNQQHTTIKLIVASVVVVLLLLLFLLRQKYLYLLFAILAFIYVLYLAIPARTVCIKKDTNLYILPVFNGIVFDKTDSILQLESLDSREGYTKVKLPDNKVGWIKNEDICSN
jgi:hypothetical protein